METFMRMPHDERHRDWSDEAARRQTKSIDSDEQKLERGKEISHNRFQREYGSAWF